ncbi:hypothetical protein CerSpe_111590 [Prunus speciosa]
MMNKRVGIRSVWQHNLDSEFALVKDALADYPFVSFETKFPFTLFEVDSPEDQYQIMKDSVNVRNIIQLRLTLSDGDGNLPDFCTDCCYVWEFNFRDFDIYRDFHSEDANAIELLKGQGIDFLRNKAKGILSSDFVTMMLKSRMTQDRRSRLTWVTCPGFYDLGYLIKILHWEELPNDVDSFMKLVDRYLGKRVYEFKSLPERLSLDWFRGRKTILATVKEWVHAHSKDSQKSLKLLAWEPPRDGYFKLNVDGCHRRGLIGAGGVIRDSEGKWIAGFAVNLGKGGVLEAELQGLYHGLKLVVQKGISHVLVESDSEIAIKFLQNPHRLASCPYRDLMSDCLELMQDIGCVPTHVYREKNSVADYLANLSYDLDAGSCKTFEIAPPCVDTELLFDRIGAAQPRLVNVY